MIRTLASAAAALLLSSCTPAPSASASPDAPPRHVAAQPPVPGHPAPASATSTPPATESLADFAKRIGVECTARGHDLACIGGKPENGDIYDVELMPDCGADGFFGGVASDAGTELRDALPPEDETTPAVLARGQLVCIQAIGRVAQDPSYFYVTAVPPSAIAACRSNRLCETYGTRTASGWHLDATKCHLSPGGRPTDACPQGWARREDIEDFSNGM